MSNRRFASSPGQKRFIQRAMQQISTRSCRVAPRIPKAELRELAAQAAAERPVQRIPEAPRRDARRS